MATQVTNEKELTEALRNESSEIEIEGDLANKVIRIKARGKVAWAVAIGAIGIIAGIIILKIPTGGTHTLISAFVTSTPTDAEAFSTNATISRIIIAIIAGSISVGVALLNKLRAYKLEKTSSTRIRLIRK